MLVFGWPDTDVRKQSASINEVPEGHHAVRGDIFLGVCVTSLIELLAEIFKAQEPTQHAWYIADFGIGDLLQR